MIWNVYASEGDVDKLCRVEADSESEAMDLAIEMWPQYRDTLFVVEV